MRQWLIALIILTQLDGSPIRIDADLVSIMKTKSHGCGPGHGAVIVVGSQTLCVRETEEQVCKIIKRCN